MRVRYESEESNDYQDLVVGEITDSLIDHGALLAVGGRAPGDDALEGFSSNLYRILPCDNENWFS